MAKVLPNKYKAGDYGISERTQAPSRPHERMRVANGEVRRCEAPSQDLVVCFGSKTNQKGHKVYGFHRKNACGKRTYKPLRARR